MSEKIRFAVFGARRGGAYAKALQYFENAELVAVCDGVFERAEALKEYCAEGARIYRDYDEMLCDGNIDAVILCNYFNEHAPAAAKALEKGIHVFSETIPASTLAECVSLCRAAEKAGATYMLAENYPYMKGPMEMKSVYESGSLGKVVYADGEYVHPMSPESYRGYTPDKEHWRAVMPSTYYLTHSLAPLMHITGTMPVAVNAKCVYTDNCPWQWEDELKKDVGAAILCEMDSGALFHITGWGKYGPHGIWYRLCCENGGAETLRGDTDRVKIQYNDWSIPQGQREETVIKSDFGEHSQAGRTGHGGGDYWVLDAFVRSLETKTQPFFDVYRSAAMSAVGILAWRSCMNGGQEYKVPDFRDEEQRKMIENDTRSPFRNAEGKVTYPRSKFDIV